MSRSRTRTPPGRDVLERAVPCLQSARMADTPAERDSGSWVLGLMLLLSQEPGARPSAKKVRYNTEQYVWCWRSLICSQWGTYDSEELPIWWWREHELGPPDHTVIAQARSRSRSPRGEVARRESGSIPCRDVLEKTIPCLQSARMTHTQVERDSGSWVLGLMDILSHAPSARRARSCVEEYVWSWRRSTSGPPTVATSQRPWRRTTSNPPAATLSQPPQRPHPPSGPPPQASIGRSSSPMSRRRRQEIKSLPRSSPMQPIIHPSRRNTSVPHVHAIGASGLYLW